MCNTFVLFVHVHTCSTMKTKHHFYLKHKTCTACVISGMKQDFKTCFNTFIRPPSNLITKTIFMSLNNYCCYPLIFNVIVLQKKIKNNNIKPFFSYVIKMPNHSYLLAFLDRNILVVECYHWLMCDLSWKSSDIKVWNHNFLVVNKFLIDF